MALALTAFEQLLSEDGIEEGKMLHNLGLRSANAKYFAFERKGELVVKLPADRVAELIASGAGRVMDRGQPERPLREWVCLRPADEAAAVAYMREARSFVDPATGYARQLTLAAPRPEVFEAVASHVDGWWRSRGHSCASNSTAPTTKSSCGSIPLLRLRRCCGPACGTRARPPGTAR